MYKFSSTTECSLLQFCYWRRFLFSGAPTLDLEHILQAAHPPGSTSSRHHILQAAHPPGSTSFRRAFQQGQSGRRVQLTICFHILYMLRSRGALVLPPLIRLHGLRRNNANCILNILNSLGLTDNIWQLHTVGAFLIWNFPKSCILHKTRRRIYYLLLYRTVNSCAHFLCSVDRPYRYICVIKTNSMHNLSSVYFVNQPLHVSGIFVAHHQEVYWIYTTIGTCCAF
jgi:hypothetical protein